MPKSAPKKGPTPRLSPSAKVSKSDTVTCAVCRKPTPATKASYVMKYAKGRHEWTSPVCSKCDWQDVPEK